MGKTTVQTRIRGKAGAGRTDFWLLLQLAGVLLVLTVAVNYVFNYVGNAMDAQYAVSSWEYVYTNSQEAPTGRAVEWQTANAFTPLSREKTGAYLHLRGTVEGAREERELILRTDYAPMRIALNGETVYDNHYGESAWVGNRYNAVVLPAGDGQIALEVALRLPFSAEFTAQIVPVGTHTGFRLNGGLIFAGIVLVLGLLAAVALPFLPVLRKKRRYGLAIAGLLVLYGLAAALLAVSGATYWVNFPQFYPLAAAAEIVVLLLLVRMAAALLELRSAPMRGLLWLSGLLAAATVAAPNVLLLRLGLLAASLSSALCLVLCARRCLQLLRRRIQYAHGFFVLLVFMAVLDGLCGVLQLWLRTRTDFTYCRIIGELVLLGFIGFILTVKSLFGENEATLEWQSARSAACVQQTVAVMQQILACRDREAVCRAAAEGVQELCRGVFSENSSETMALAVLEKENGVYRRLYSRHLEGDIRTVAIESRCADSGKLYVFAQTYFDFLFPEPDGRTVLLHFENLRNALEPFFTSVMATVYCCTSVALAAFTPGVTAVERKQTVFTELAADTEKAGGNNRTHLERVAAYTRLMMEQLGYPAETAALVARAAMLHDIGKTVIPAAITNKTGLLSESERAVIKKHTAYGETLLSVFDGAFMRSAAQIAAQHHEHYDGTGYNGLKGDSIDEYARIVAVADTLDALTTKRSYKEAWSLEEAVAYIDARSGTMFDPRAVDAMHQCLDTIRMKITER